MRRRTKLSVEPKYILAVCSVICLVLVLVSFKFGDKLQPVKTSIGTVVAPMQKGINSVGRFIYAQFEKFDSIRNLQTENERLKSELDKVTYENKMLQQDKYELESLRKLYKLDKKYASYPKVAARVISEDTSNWHSTFLIDKGTNDGLAVNMNVLAGNSLVGIVTETGKNYSRVRSIIDDTSNVSGMFLKTSDPCIVSGNLKLLDKGKIDVSLIPKDADIKDGYEIVTSNNSPKFLQGILIGYVTDIKLDSTSTTKSAHLTPAVDFEKLDTVLVITEVKEGAELKAMLDQ